MKNSMPHKTAQALLRNFFYKLYVFAASRRRLVKKYNIYTLLPSVLYKIFNLFSIFFHCLSASCFRHAITSAGIVSAAKMPLMPAGRRHSPLPLKSRKRTVSQFIRLLPSPEAACLKKSTPGSQGFPFLRRFPGRFKRQALPRLQAWQGRSTFYTIMLGLSEIVLDAGNGIVVVD